jgi:hypothetical protein
MNDCDTIFPVPPEWFELAMEEVDEGGNSGSDDDQVLGFI